ncbi:MAG: Fic family protein [Patescibacteria group bacterium]
MDATLFLENFIFESDAIENIGNNRKELRADIIARRATGHVGALFFLDSLAHERAPLDEAAICTVQSLITREQHLKEGGKQLCSEAIGRYRIGGVSIIHESWFPLGDVILTERRLIRRCPPGKDIPRLMRNWIRRSTRWRLAAPKFTREENVRRIADLYFDFEWIHPFVDGNGRTGRALTYYHFMAADLEPFVFTAYDKAKTHSLCFEKKKKMREYFHTRVFRRDTIMGRIETMSPEDL